ncbi:MAG: metallophosphoesterase [Elusimicrobiota bacterium]|jgi:hypothetical protein
MLHILGFLAAVVLVYLGMQYYAAFWLIRSFPGLPLAPAAVRIAVLLLALLFPISVWALRHGGAGAQALALGMYVWTGILLIWVFWAACGDLAALILRRLAPSSAAALRPFLAWGVVAGVLLSSVYAAWNAARLPRVVTHEVVLPGLKAEHDEFTLVHISDLHVGLTVPLKRLEAIADMVDKLHPDLVVLTGDLVDPGPVPREAIVEAGKRLHARYGKLAVLGNHEFYHGLSDSLDCLAACGARVLRGEVAEVQGIQFIGIDDIMAAGLSREDVAATLSSLDPAKPSVLLSHQPRHADLAAEKGVGLMLSGHTHQGQIFPFGLLVRLSYRYLYGLYRIGDMSLYVTSGAGHWGPPMRFLTRSEIAVLVLRSPDAPTALP